MKETFDQGIAFVFEGDTEKYFYISLLKFWCNKYPNYTLVSRTTDYEEEYIIQSETKSIIVCINTVGTITQITHSGNWFNNTCANRFSAKTPWCVCLCYDTDSHNNDITKFHVGDWKALRESITNRQNIIVIDVAAKAEIEDIFLLDLSGISKFLGLEKELASTEIPMANKGKRKLKMLFRQYQKTYHEGSRAKDLIEALDKQVIINQNVLPLNKIEEIIFK